MTKSILNTDCFYACRQVQQTQNMSKYTYCTVVNRTPCDIKSSPILTNIFNSKGLSQPQSQAFFTFSQKRKEQLWSSVFTPRSYRNIVINKRIQILFGMVFLVNLTLEMFKIVVTYSLTTIYNNFGGRYIVFSSLLLFLTIFCMEYIYSF